jgi:hypothetical protein
MDMSIAAPASGAIDERRRHVDNALGSLRIEGLEIDARTRAIADRYIAGDISIDEMTQTILQLP